MPPPMQPMDARPAPESKLKQNMEISTLCAFYGGLLTERQRMAIQLHFDEDWSLAEVADHFGVSRQNIHDLITRAAQKLYTYEKAVGGVAQARRVTDGLRKAEARLMGAPGNEAVREALTLIKQIISEFDGEE